MSGRPFSDVGDPHGSTTEDEGGRDSSKKETKEPKLGNGDYGRGMDDVDLEVLNRSLDEPVVRGVTKNACSPDSRTPRQYT